MVQQRDCLLVDDRLSKLPDDILLTILDRLHVHHATRTSVLSSRWRHLHAMLSQLNIDFFGIIRPEDTRPALCDDEIARLNAATVEATKSVLANRASSSSSSSSSRNKIQSLRVSFFLKDDDVDDAISIGRAVGNTMMAAAHRDVETAEFTLLTEKNGDFSEDDDHAGNGRRFMAFFDACPIAFGGLTSLQLEGLRFGGELDIHNVLLTCNRLKQLRLVHCDSGSWPVVLEAQHSQLSELAIIQCSFVRLELSSLPKLRRMTFVGWDSLEDALCLGYVPLLEALSLGNLCRSYHEMVKLSNFLVGTSLQHLKLGFLCEKIWVQPECLTNKRNASSIFNQLRSVYLNEIPQGYDLTWTMFILEVATNLKELYLTVWDHLCDMITNDEERKELSFSDNKGIDWESSTSNFRHHSLATLTIFGFHHEEEDYMVRHVRRVMEAAVNLEDVFLWPTPTCSDCRGNNTCNFPFTEPEKCLVATRITFGLQSSATVHFSTTGSARADHDARIVFP